MTTFVAYVPVETIEKDAQALLAEYAYARGVKVKLPVPIDDIIEKHLKIGIEFDDMHRLVGVPRSGFGFDPDILGAIFFDERRMTLTRASIPTPIRPRKGAIAIRRRMRSAPLAAASRTVWQRPGPPSVICRSSEAKARIELQADLYASCLPMPGDLVHAEWTERLGRTKPLLLGLSMSRGEPRSTLLTTRSSTTRGGSAALTRLSPAIPATGTPVMQIPLGPASSVGIRDRRPGARNGKPS
jgi:hypothetical protein